MPPVPGERGHAAFVVHEIGRRLRAAMPRRGLLVALALSLALHAALSFWPGEIETTPEVLPLQASIVEMPPPPMPAAPVAAKPKPKPQRPTARTPPAEPPRPAVEEAAAKPPEPELIAEFMEKGVIRRTRLDSVFLPRERDVELVAECCSQFATRPLPLTT